MEHTSEQYSGFELYHELIDQWHAYSRHDDSQTVRIVLMEGFAGGRLDLPHFHGCLFLYNHTTRCYWARAHVLLQAIGISRLRGKLHFKRDISILVRVGSENIKKVISVTPPLLMNDVRDLIIAKRCRDTFGTLAIMRRSAGAWCKV